MVLWEFFLGMTKHRLLVKGLACPKGYPFAVKISLDEGKEDLSTSETMLEEANSARDV